MDIIFENGNVNVGLVTIICASSMVLLFVIISIFSIFSKKPKEDDVEESGVDEISKSGRNNTKEKKPKSKPKYKKSPPKNVVTESNDKNNKPIVKKEKNEKKKVSSSVVEKGRKDNSIPKIKHTPQKSKPKSKPTSSTTPTEKPNPPKHKDKLNHPKEVIIKGKNKSKERDKPKKEIWLNNYDLTDAEYALIKPIIASNERGRIVQIYQGTKIMNFNINNDKQLGHINKQIDSYRKETGQYLVYVIWDSKLVHKINMYKKLRYNPNFLYK